jgi:anti-sigma-K factor RskA
VNPRGDAHQPFDELAVGWALHALEPEDEALFGAHLPTCPRCDRTVAETSEVMSAMAGDLPQAEPSDRLRDRLRAAVAETEQLPPPAGVQPRAAVPAAVPTAVPVPAGGADTSGGRRRTDRPGATASGYLPPPPGSAPGVRSVWRRVLPNALVAAAVAAVLALGTWNVALSSARDDAQAVAADQQQVVQALLQPGRTTVAPVDGDDDQPVATVVARDDRVEVVTHGLQVNDSGRTVYVLWGMADGSPVGLGRFDVVSPRIDVQTVGSASAGLDDYAEYAISIEPGRQMPSTPTVVVATGQVTS